MAVLASVCDPHLNTIHAVCQRFSESRGLVPSGRGLNPPRPVDRPLNVYKHFSSTQLSQPSHIVDGPVIPSFDFSFANSLPLAEYIPTLGLDGPLTVPYLEPPHPVFNLELDCSDIWACVLSVVDMSRTDAEGLASSLTGKVRCYGFGPVIMKQDVIQVCSGQSSRV